MLDEIRATGAAWVSEAELDYLLSRVEQVEQERDEALSMADALLAERDRLRAALERIAEEQPKALAWIRREGFVFDDIGAKAGVWQHAAFTLYSELCAIDDIARTALSTEEPDPTCPSCGRTALQPAPWGDASCLNFHAGDYDPGSTEEPG